MRALNGGKRFRPFLVVAAADLFDVPRSQALTAGAALECVHCYSLVHDDLPAMDDDDLRRGQPTVHKAFDEGTAILAGDALLTLAFEILAATATHADPGVRAELVAGLAARAGLGGMVGGQMLDLEAEGRLRRRQPDARRASSAPAGDEDRRAAALCLRGRRDPGTRRRRAAPARWRSTASGWARPSRSPTTCSTSRATRDAVGKATGKDADAGKATLVRSSAWSAPRARCAELVTEAEQALAPFGKRARLLVDAATFVALRKV